MRALDFASEAVALRVSRAVARLRFPVCSCQNPEAMQYVCGVAMPIPPCPEGNHQYVTEHEVMPVKLRNGRWAVAITAGMRLVAGRDAVVDGATVRVSLTSERTVEAAELVDAVVE